MSSIQSIFPECTHIFVVDFEATCGPGIKASKIEIIEFGGVLLPLNPITSVDDALCFHSYIRPINHAKLTRFCRKLTGVSQTDVDDAPVFEDVIAKMNEWFTTHGVNSQTTIFTSWSAFDAQQLRRECLHHELPCPFEHFMDLQVQFKRTQQHSSTHSVSKALEAVGLEFEGRQHSAIDDAKNTARLLPFSGYGEAP